MTYTKDSGDVSQRAVIVVARPRDNYLMYDVSKLSDEAVEALVNAVKMAEEYRDNCIADFELVTGIKQASLWRSFKPGGVEWETEDDEI